MPGHSDRSRPVEASTSPDWEAIYRQCAPALRRFIRTRVPEALVEDTLQDTFVRACRSGARLDPNVAPLPWLLTIARRASYETVRVMPRELPQAGLELMASPWWDDPHQQFEARMRRELMSRALAGLSARQRRLLVAWEFEGRSPYPMLAEREGVTTQALKSALCRARSSFRTRYTALAERAGVAAVLAWTPARLRARLQRAWAWAAHGSPLAEAAVGVFAVALVSAAVVLMPSVPASDASPALVPAASSAPGIEPVVTSVPTVPVQRPAARDDRAVVGEAPRSGLQPTTSLTVRAHDSSGVSARSDTDVSIGPDASSGSLRIRVSDPIGGTSVDKEVEIYCDGNLLRVACQAADEIGPAA